MSKRSDDRLLERPIIVIGAPRSGTSTLGRILSQHSTLAYLVEPRLTWKIGNDGKSDLLRPEDARPEVITRIRARLAAHVREHGRERLLEKLPSNALRIPFLDRVLPDARFVHILRDGYNSVLSIHNAWTKSVGKASGTGIDPARVRPDLMRQRLRELTPARAGHYAVEFVRRAAPPALHPLVGHHLWGPRIPALRQLVREMDLLEVCALQWRTCVELAHEAGSQLPAGRYLEIRIEDLDEAALERVLAFGELAREEPLWDYFREIFDPSRSGYRKAAADEDVLARIRPWIASTQASFGYDR